MANTAGAGCKSTGGSTSDGLAEVVGCGVDATSWALGSSDAATGACSCTSCSILAACAAQTISFPRTASILASVAVAATSWSAGWTAATCSGLHAASDTSSCCGGSVAGALYGEAATSGGCAVAALGADGAAFPMLTLSCCLAAWMAASALDTTALSDILATGLDTAPEVAGDRATSCMREARDATVVAGLPYPASELRRDREDPLRAEAAE